MTISNSLFGVSLFPTNTLTDKDCTLLVADLFGTHLSSHESVL